MKKLLLASVLLLLLVSQVSGLALTFQNPGDFASYVSQKCVWIGGACTGEGTYAAWQDNAISCANSYIRVLTPATGKNFIHHWIINTDANPTSYAAATLISNSVSLGNKLSIRLFDSSGAELYTYLGSPPVANGRFEIKMSGGAANIYQNGTLLATSGALAQNPSFIGWGVYRADSANPYSDWDDLVMGDDETGWIFGVPAEGCYLKRDPIGGGSGLYNATGTLINTYNMSMAWAKKSDGVSATIALQNWGTGVNAESFTTGTSTIFGTKSWAIADYVTNTYNYGYYVGTVSPTIVGAYSRTVPYQMGGGTASWSSDQYSQNDLATVTVSISDGPAPSPDYWDTGTYTYSMVVSDLYGNVKQTTTVTSPSQGINYQFSSNDDLGVYVASLYMTRISTGVQYLMWQDLTTVNGYIRVEGYAYNSSSMEPLSSVHINITQSSYYQAQYTSATGYYNTSASIPFGTGALLTINATKPGYRQRVISFTPLSAKTITLDIPMIPLSLPVTGIAMGGIVGSTPYGQPIPDVNVIATNDTYGETRNVTTNSVGFYLFDDAHGGGSPFVNGRCYSLASVKTGYTHKTPLGVTCVWGV